MQSLMLLEKAFHFDMLKNKRIVNKKLLDEIKPKPCIACGRLGPNDVHHIKTKKSGGHDIRENLISLCREHHQMWHAKGTSYMVTFYNNVNYWLRTNGWAKEQGKWRRWK